MKTYEVIYKYEGKVPEKAPELPKTLSYEEGELVKTAEEPALEGYRFSGWKADNLETEDGAFRMPAETVTLRGSFEKIKPAATAAPSKAPSAAPVRASHLLSRDRRSLRLSACGALHLGSGGNVRPHSAEKNDLKKNAEMVGFCLELLLRFFRPGPQSSIPARLHLHKDSAFGYSHDWNCGRDNLNAPVRRTGAALFREYVCQEKILDSNRCL